MERQSISVSVRGETVPSNAKTSGVAAELNLDVIHLTDVDWLRFKLGEYDIDKVRTIIANMGTRLTKLDMTAVSNVDITHIINCCSVLKILDFDLCRDVMSENFIFAPELPHFKSVTEIIVKCIVGFEYFLKFLHHYVNLEFFHAEYVRELEHVTVCISKCRWLQKAH
jgi:hypothetical protein